MAAVVELAVGGVICNFPEACLDINRVQMLKGKLPDSGGIDDRTVVCQVVPVGDSCCMPPESRIAG